MPLQAVRIALLTLLLVVGGCPGPDPAGPGESLSDVEEELVGLWSRYRSSNQRTEYYLFKSNRTGCYWEETSANYDKLNLKNYSGWDIDEDNPVSSGEYILDLPGSGLSSGLTFDWVFHRLWVTGVDNVIWNPSNDDRSC